MVPEELDFDKPLQLIRPGAEPAPVRLVKRGTRRDVCTNFGNYVVEFHGAPRYANDWYAIVIDKEGKLLERPHDTTNWRVENVEHKDHVLLRRHRGHWEVYSSALMTQQTAIDVASADPATEWKIVKVL